MYRRMCASVTHRCMPWQDPASEIRPKEVLPNALARRTGWDYCMFRILCLDLASLQDPGHAVDLEPHDASVDFAGSGPLIL